MVFFKQYSLILIVQYTKSANQFLFKLIRYEKAHFYAALRARRRFCLRPK